MAYLRVLLGFANDPDHQLEEIAGHVIDNLYALPAADTFPNPPVALNALRSTLTNFTNAIAAQCDGGVTATANKDVARLGLIAPLRTLAMFVQTTVQADPSFGLAQLLSTGFDAVSTSRTQSPLEQPTILKVLNDDTGHLKLQVKPVRNARTYEAQFQAVGGSAWQSAGAFTSTRSMIVSGLTPGVMYALRVRAVGGSTGFSPWSDAVSHMST